ncbi:MAG: transporter substrate-binding domain-containing protein [Tannerellaceae bacterium]|nr:transporter substrate-binding domain-containing protein [Tannerellaceae bacterium]
MLLTFSLTLFYRRKDPEFPTTWYEGFSLNLYHLMVAIQTGSIENKLTGWIGHLLAVVWMVFGIGLVAYVTSTITSSMTKISLTSDIHSLADLSGKLVGVEEGGIEERYLSNLGIATVPYNNIIDAAEGLLNDEVSAVVGDVPVLEYWIHTNRSKKLEVTGNLFHPDKYAFAVSPDHSHLMDSISLQLIRLYDTGRIKN